MHLVSLVKNNSNINKEAVMKSTAVLSLSAMLLAPIPALADHTVIDGMDFGPLAQLVGTWKSVESGGVDISPAQAGTEQGKGAPALPLSTRP